MASSSSTAESNKKYDVFISFRGSDIRQGFLSHLHKALLDQKIEAFVDEQLERGKEISESLLNKIEESHVALVIYSQNYAYSEWCLEELRKIVECRNTTGQIVIPVFYGVDPSHVQDLTGSYGDAMFQHRTQFDESLVEIWGNVLKETASLSGLVSSNFKTESNLVEEIIKQALEKLNCLYPSDSSCDDGLVGINYRVDKVMSLLCCSEDVCIVGIWGEGGIGKTTLAQAVFDRIRSQFDSPCFIRNMRERSEKCTRDFIQNEVVSKLYGTSKSDITRKRLSRKKVILVVDDVSDMDQLKPIIRYKVDFGCGSKIIITSRDIHLLKIMGAKIYAVEKLDNYEALQLFCLNAFNRKAPHEEYLELSKRAVKYAQGIPLALEVLGCNLFGRSAEEWEDELEKLKCTSDQKIQRILRISYDGLSDVEKDIFLDIACFLKGKPRGDVESLLDIPGAKIGISRLVEKALISIMFENRINMHDLIEKMAKDIICEEKILEKRRWLWDPEEIYFLLTREMGTEAVRGIALDMSKIRDINLSPKAFLKLYNLRFLTFYTYNGNSQLCVPQGLEYLPEQLRYLFWDQCPSKSLRLTSFWMEKLVELNMRHNQNEELWNGAPNLPNLKRVDFSWSTKLIKVPDLSTASNLELLNLFKCTSLVEIPSLTHMSKLAELKLNFCSSIDSLPDNICNLKSLSRLSVSNCENLRGLPQNFGNLKSLKKFSSNRSGVKVLPESFCNLKACTTFNVSMCVDLQGLPPNLGNLKSLQGIYATGSGIKEMPTSINNLPKLRRLSFHGCKGLILPPLTGDFPHLSRIELSKCEISEFPVGLCSVTSLTDLKLGGNNFESIPESIRNLLKLRILELNDCKKLKYLPESIQHLLELRELNLRDCTSLDQNQCPRIIDHILMAILEVRRLDFTCVRYLGSKVAENMMHKYESGSSLSFSFQLLQSVNDGDGLGFYACAVLEVAGHVVSVRCEGNFMEESGRSICVEGNVFGSGRVHNMTIESKELLLLPLYCRSRNFKKGTNYTAELQFQWLTDYRGSHWSSDGIITCGVFSLFSSLKIE